MSRAVAPHVSIIILNWNGIRDTLACLKSLDNIIYTEFSTIVVDNGSVDDSLTYLRSHKASYPLKIIETGANLGFAEGNNVGIRVALDAGTDYLLLLNNDTEVHPSIIGELVSAAAAHEDAGILGPKIYYHANPMKLWYAGARWLVDEQYFQHIGINQIDDGVTYEVVAETDYACGCALLISAQVIRQIGLMDPKFFLTYEETDWCYMARMAGYSVLFVPSAKLWHKVSASFGGADSPLQLYFYSRNILLWAERHLSRREYWSLFRRTVNEALRFGSSSDIRASFARRAYWNVASLGRRLRRGGTDPAGRARYLGLRDYFLRRFGDCPDEVRALKVAR